MSIVNSQLSITPTKRLIIIGAGGLGREVLQYIYDINSVEPQFDVIGFVDENPELKGKSYRNVPIIGGFDSADEIEGDLYAVCAVANPAVKETLVNKGIISELQFVNIIHPSSYVAETAQIGEGVIIGPGCVISTDVVLGNHVTINPQCGIGHDVTIDDFATLYWSVNLAGFVYIEKDVEIGSKAFIKQNIQVGYGSVVGAGAVVTTDIESGTTVVGVPAKKVEEPEGE